MLDSTNIRAKNDISRGEVESGTVYIAEFQTDGVGRRGSQWIGEAGKSLLCSIVLETGLPSTEIPRLSIATGVALTQALGPEFQAKVKWPNDVYLGPHKVAGILVEHSDCFTIIGVGINVHQTEFPSHLNATSLTLANGSEVGREKLMANVADQILKWASLCGSSFKSVKKVFDQIDYLKGALIQFESSGKKYRGRVEGIDEDGRLRAKVDGKTMVLTSALSIKLI